MSALVERRRFSREEYHRLGETGILHEDDRLELLDGELNIMSPIGVAHARAVHRLHHHFHLKFLGQCLVYCQSPVALDEHSEPQPDILLLRPECEETDDHPRPSDLHLVVEVADTSLGYDRGVKLKAYAAALVCEVWILNLGRSELEIYRDPSQGSYQSAAVLRRSDFVEVQAFPSITFAVSDLLP